MKKILFSLVLTFLQALLFLALNDLFVFIYSAFIKNPSFNLNWGISLRIAFFLFVVISLFSNILCVSLKRRRVIIILISFFLFSLFWLRDIQYTPYRAALLLLISLLSFVSSLFFLWLIEKLFGSKVFE